MRQTTLVIMAAGMGSRFGGLKQLEPFGPNGETILDFSVYDAKKAGFSKVVFIIKQDFAAEFRETVGKRIEREIDVSYVYQSLDQLPAGFSVPEGRVKPWGTGHAIWCARDAVTTPFAAINADDFYGRHSFQLLHDHIAVSDEICMVGFRLGNTLTENGTVSRGVCDTCEGLLKSITEVTAIDKNSGIALDTVVSMNMWGFTPAIFDDLENGFIDFLRSNSDPKKGEYYLPSLVDHLIKQRAARVHVLQTDEKWYGVTYQQDKAAVKAAIAKKMKEGLYLGI